jgi:hypothetical protein
MARVNSTGEHVVLVLTHREARALRLLARRGFSVADRGEIRAAGARALDALNQGLVMVERGERSSLRRRR